MVKMPGINVKGARRQRQRRRMVWNQNHHLMRPSTWALLILLLVQDASSFSFSCHDRTSTGTCNVNTKHGQHGSLMFVPTTASASSLVPATRIRTGTGTSLVKTRTSLHSSVVGVEGDKVLPTVTLEESFDTSSKELLKKSGEGSSPGEGQDDKEKAATTGTTGTKTNRQSPASIWHSQRRKEMLQKYGSQISPLERHSSSHGLALTLLTFVNVSLVGLATLVAPQLAHAWQVFLLALFPGSILSLWQLQILHDNIHGSLLAKKQSSFEILGLEKKISKKDAASQLLFWGSMPSMFGYYLYLKYGHLTHHQHLGSESHGSNLGQVFGSSDIDFEDGDVLFTAHRMKLKGPIGPTLALPQLPIQDKPVSVTMSISRSFFTLWREGHPLWNAAVFAISFPLERIMLCTNDFVVALTGRNYFFPNKPQQFHDECATYCRCAAAVRLSIFALGGWKAWLFLTLSEVLWSIPPHPACAMFVTNHGSDTDHDDVGVDVGVNGGGCIPSSSTYAGRWYSLLTLGTNYHVEHHDFPTIPLHRLGDLRQIAPEYYPRGSKDNVFQIMRHAFSKPDFYACMDASNLGSTQVSEER
jgi:fatty acid desaturase